jgi:DNA-binding NarL/FixJ family response regulator
VSKASLQRRTTICLFSSHPLLASEFKRVLSEEEFRPLFRRLDPDAAPGIEKLGIPRASVFVVEADRRQEATEGLAAVIVGHHAGARLLIIAEKLTEAGTFALLRLGAKGLLTYKDVPTQLSRALHTIAGGGFWVPRALLSRFVETTLSATRRTRPLPLTGSGGLSRREKEVLELLLQNLSNKEIAGELHISSRTAKFHVSNLLSKHGVRRRADLILLTHTRSEARVAPAKS